MKSIVVRALVLPLSLAACTGARIVDHGDGGDEDISGINDREGQICANWGDERVCGKGDAGMQYCGDLSDDGAQILWGVCVADPECALGDSQSCDADGNQSCELVDGEPVWGECYQAVDEESTPLVIVFPGDRIEFEAAGSASFELGDTCSMQDWPSAATPWLAIDLDGNGSIDGGHELFGSDTRLASGARAHHGFLALAELDADHDGAITPKDPRYADLVLWSDHDGDRRSTHWEHESLTSRGIVSIPLAYTSERDCDARGNCSIERAALEIVEGNATQAGAVVDVHLACQ